MAVHQYIGARYVPRFRGTYDPTTQYEGLDVVDNGLGTSYIATKPTPAGTPLTDTTHWAIYGSSSGAVINLQNQIDQINNVDLPAINSDISAIDTALEEVQDLKTELVIFGDSWTDTAVPEAVWANIVGATLGKNVHNYAKNGAAFDTGTFQNELTAFQNDTSYDKSKIHSVVMLFGVNDIWTHPVSNGSVEASYMNTFLTGLISAGLDPKTPIYHFINFYYGAKDVSATKHYGFWKTYKYNILNKGFNLVVKDIHPWFGAIDMDNANFFHLTQNAQKNTLAPNIIAVLNGVEPDNKATFAAECTFDDNGTTRNVSVYMNWLVDRVELAAFIPPCSAAGEHVITPTIPFPSTMPRARVTENMEIQVTSDSVVPGPQQSPRYNQLKLNYLTAQSGNRWIFATYNLNNDGITGTE